MIFVDKSRLMPNPPDSLKPAMDIVFFPGLIPRKSRTTSARRRELIDAGRYHNVKKYNDRYKLRDIKTALKKLYKTKCAYCEQYIEQYHVEHYRPKTFYPWLAYSWDNLFCCCHFCNVHKGTNFRINGPKAAFSDTPANLLNINNLASEYDLIEAPDLINPEITNPIGHIIFNNAGKISSTQSRFNYTIETIKIDRKDLNDRRLHILQTLRNDLQAAYLKPTPDTQLAAISTIVEKFKNDAVDPKNEFLAFRKYVIDNWINDEIKNARP